MQAQDQLEKYVELGQLFSYYGPLLPEKTRRTLASYLTDNLTLSEIAENEGCSRQAVHAQVKQGCHRLYAFDLQLGLLQKAELYLDLEQKLIEQIRGGRTESALAVLQAVRALFSLEDKDHAAKSER